MAKAVNSTSPPHSIQVVTRRHVLVRRENIPGYMLMRSILNALQEDHQDILRSLTHNIPKSQLATQAAELTVREVKSSPSHPSYTRRTKQPCSTPPRFSSCNLHLMPTTPCRQTSRGTKPKKQVGPCCASSLRARRNIHVTSRKRARAMAELSALREHLAAIEVLREENHAI